MSVLLGIKSRGTGNWAQKRARLSRVPQARRGFLARGWSLDQIPHPRKGLKGPINRHFARLRPAGYGGTSPPAGMAGSPPRAGLPSRSCAAAKAGGPAWIRTRIKSIALLPRRRFPPPGRADHRRSRRREPSLPPINPNWTEEGAPARRARSKRVPRHKGHPPRIVADIEMGARGGKSGCRQLRHHLGFAVALQPDLGAQLPVVRQRGRDQPDQGVLQEAVA